MNVVTTLPSATEILTAIGVEPVGVSHECDFPPEVSRLPSITRSRIDASATSAEIDQQVLEMATDTEPVGREDESEESASGVYDIDTRTLEALEPDLIVTQGICDVCAVDEVVVERALEEIDADPTVVTTDPHTVGDVLADVAEVGQAVGRDERARTVIADLERRIDAVRERTAQVAVDDRPRVAILDWTNPVMIAGHWMPELVTAAGGTYGMAAPADPSRPYEWDALAAYDPEVLLVAPCGFGLEQTAQNLCDLTTQPGWNELTAVENGRAWVMDGHHYVNRPGPRIVDTLEYLAPIVHPALFDTPPESVTLPLEDLERRLEPAP